MERLRFLIKTIRLLLKKEILLGNIISLTFISL